MKGAIVKIRFLDHSLNNDKPIECEVFGRVVKSRKKFLVVAYWRVLDRKLKHNDETMTILKSTIIEIVSF